MAKKQEQQPKGEITRYGSCKNKGDEVYEFIYKCLIYGEPHHSVFNCKNINKKPKNYYNDKK